MTGTCALSPTDCTTEQWHVSVLLCSCLGQPTSEPSRPMWVVPVEKPRQITRKVRKLDPPEFATVLRCAPGPAIIGIPMLKSLDPFRFVLIAVAGWMNQHQLQVIDYLREENRVLREQLGGRRLRLSDDQRRRLAAKAKTLEPAPPR